MVKVKSFKKLGILLISLISIISMAKVQVNAIRFKDGRFITNDQFISAIIDRTKFMFDAPPIYLVDVSANKPQIQFAIMSACDIVRSIVLTVRLQDSEKYLNVSLVPKKFMLVTEALNLLCYSRDDIIINDLFEFNFMSTKEIPQSMTWVRLAPPEFYMALNNTTDILQYNRLVSSCISNPTIKAYQMSNDEFIVINNVEVQYVSRSIF